MNKETKTKTAPAATPAGGERTTALRESKIVDSSWGCQFENRQIEQYLGDVIKVWSQTNRCKKFHRVTRERFHI